MASAAHAVPSFEIVPSQYVIMPQHGVCVVTGYNTMEAGGTTTEVTVLRPVKDLKSTIMKPTHRLAHFGIRAPLGAEAMQEILRGAFSAIKGDGGGHWRHREADYNELLLSGSAENMAVALNKVLSKHRTPKWKEENAGSELPLDTQISISYSERQIANAALKYLGEELAHATGMREREARTMLLRAALVPGFAAKITLSGEKAAPPMMDAGQFKEIFGHAPGEAISNAIKVDTAKRDMPFTYHHGHERGTAKRFSGDATYDDAPKERKIVRLRVQPTARPKETQQEIPALNREVVRKEQDKAPLKGTMRGLWLIAARILDPQEFEILSRTALRRKENLESMQVAANAMGMDVAAMIEIRNAAAKKVMDASPYDFSKPKAPKILLPYEEKPMVQKAPKPPKEPKPPKAEKPPREVKEKYVVAEGNRALFTAEEHMMSPKGMMRGLFLTAARVLEPEEFQIVAQTALRRGGKLTMEQAAAAMDLPLADAIELRNRAMATLVKETGYNPEGPRAPAFLKPYEVKPAFERAVKPVKDEPAPKAHIERGITTEQIGFAQVGDETVVIIRVPKAAMEGSYGLKLDLSWNKAVSAAPEIVKAEGGIKSRGGPHAANGNAELAEPAIQPPPSTLDPS